MSIPADPLAGVRLCFHVGYHKTASTWMQIHAFGLHPDVTLVNRPASRFDRLWYERFVEAGDYAYDETSVRADLEKAIGCPDGRRVYVLSEENISGHAYSGWNAARNAERLRSLVAGIDCRIFIVIRRQSAYVLSAYANYVNQGGALSFGNWFADHDIPARTILDKLAYHHEILHYRKLFGDSNVLVLPYELMRKDGGIELMNRLFAFVGVKPLPASDFAPIVGRTTNSGLSPLGTRTLRLLNGIRGGISMNQRRAAKALDLALARLPWQPQLASASTLREIDAAFRDSNRRVGELIGIDLGRYGYSV